MTKTEIEQLLVNLVTHNNELHQTIQNLCRDVQLIEQDKQQSIKNTGHTFKSVFIGKSIIKKLKNDSGQNPMDAAKLNCKIYHGPYVNNFKEIYKILEKNNIAKKINTYEELSSNLIKDLKSPSKNNNYNLKAIDSLGRKTLSDTMKNINKFIFNDIKKT